MFAAHAIASVAEEVRRCGQILRAMLSFSRQEDSERWLEKTDLVVRRAVRAIRAGAAVIVIAIDVPDADCVRMTVSDDGAGISESVRAGIFDSFFTTHPESASGLGLTVARAIMEAHGGEISLTATGAEGRTFRSELSRARAC